MSKDPKPEPGTPLTSERKLQNSASRPLYPSIVDSAELFLGQSLLLVRHMGEIYRLQITRQGKLILTK